ncbi:AAA family ATPase [Roseibium sp. RKSG952]|uniref:AAA family ATPase n=1 Tax=Roseibium sp. RKSG952 TaxID=2529384 RepID=UPI0012BBF0BB|nr:AAA family ATPase [Roseibium sp. RKSG952]MTH95306.1 helicase, RecD/TraA family protein [Roseibium sp. RKSG952]
MESVRATLIRYLKAPTEENANGFAIVRYESSTGMHESKMGGPFHVGIRPGDWFLAKGEWKKNTYRQRDEEIFSAKSLRPTLPQTKRGCLALFQATFNPPEAYGASRDSIIDFIEKHGREAAFLAEKKPDLLFEITSDSTHHRQAIYRAWGQRISARKPFTLMESAGVDPRAMEAIVDRLRDDTMRVLKENPYVLAPVEHVGFKNADLIGNEVGIATGDELRVVAVMSDILREAGSEGHTYVPISSMASGLKDAKVGIADIAPLFGKTSGGVVFDRYKKDAIAQQEPLYVAEVTIAKRVAELLRKGRSQSKTEIDAVSDKVLTGSGYSHFDDIQMAAVRTSAREAVSILTGGPGTGKSTVTEAIAEIGAATSRGPVILLSPTGKASRRLEETTGRKAMTVHSALEAKEGSLGESTFGRNASNPLPEECFVIVDEASMLDTETAAALLRAIPESGRLLLIGDRHQLPSVGPGYVLGDLIAAKSENGNSVPCSELITVYRQNGQSMIAHGAKEINEGRMPYLDEKERGGLMFLNHTGHKIVEWSVGVATRIAANRLNLNPRRDVAVLSPQRPGLAGTWQINKEMSKILNPNGVVPDGVVKNQYDDKDMPLPRVGDRIMLTRNDKDNDVVNGDLGWLTRFVTTANGTRKDVKLEVKFDAGKTVQFPVWRWRDLVPAYSITSHKSQGSQYPMVVMPVTMEHKEMLERTLLYTAWTRAKNYLIIVGEREALEYAVSNVKSANRQTRLKSFLEDELQKIPSAPAVHSARTPFQTGAQIEGVSAPKPSPGRRGRPQRPGITADAPAAEEQAPSRKEVAPQPQSRAGRRARPGFASDPEPESGTDPAPSF